MLDSSLWGILPSVPARYLADTASFHPLVSQLLYNRGIDSLVEADSFLNPERTSLMDPFLLPDMGKAVGRIIQALSSNEKIAIWGDFDADGISGTAVLVEGLSSLGGEVVPYIPHRQDEGYGLNKSGLEMLYQDGVRLLITVDCGIGAVSEVEYAMGLGLDVIVTDHHTVSSRLPQAIAVVDPKCDGSLYPFCELAGVGVAFKLLEAMTVSLGKSETWDSLLDLVAIGTVADMVPLVSENRYLARRGLEVLNNTGRIGLREMMNVSRLQLGRLTSESISWVIGPRLNTAGRLDHASPAYQLMVTKSGKEARQLAVELEDANTERRRITDVVWSKARAQVSPSGAEALLLIAASEDYHPGVLGVVASRLVDEFHRPAVVMRIESDASKGSTRSISSFNFIAALMECKDILLQFGGHPMAAGFTVSNDKVGELLSRLQDIAARQLAFADLKTRLTIDVDVRLRDLGEETFELLKGFAPYGVDNSEPVFLSRRVGVVNMRSVGKDGGHLKLELRDGGRTWDAIAFNMGQFVAEVTSELDVVYKLTKNYWNGNETLQLNLLDFAPSA